MLICCLLVFVIRIISTTSKLNSKVCTPSGAKTKVALAAGMKVIACIGEKLEDRDGGKCGPDYLPQVAWGRACFQIT